VNADDILRRASAAMGVCGHLEADGEGGEGEGKETEKEKKKMERKREYQCPLSR
jgi:hypothetical protein